jgi:hypothetical protein
MSNKICLALITIFIPVLSKAQNETLTHKKETSTIVSSDKGSLQQSNSQFFQGTKTFCCPYRKTKYRLSIKGNEITIIAIYKGESTIKGAIRNNKIYTNDAQEKNNKMLAGKVYILKNNTFRILTSEGGEYDEFSECD